MTVSQKNISRRSLAKGAAWAAPAVLATAAIPAYAASTICVDKATTTDIKTKTGFEILLDGKTPLDGYLFTFKISPTWQSKPEQLKLTLDAIQYEVPAPTLLKADTPGGNDSYIYSVPLYGTGVKLSIDFGSMYYQGGANYSISKVGCPGELFFGSWSSGTTWGL